MAWDRIFVAFHVPGLRDNHPGSLLFYQEHSFYSPLDFLFFLGSFPYTERDRDVKFDEALGGAIGQGGDGVSLDATCPRRASVMR